MVVYHGWKEDVLSGEPKGLCHGSATTITVQLATPHPCWCMGQRQSKSAKLDRPTSEEMRGVTSLLQIPTLRQLYSNEALRRPTNAQYKADEALLDRVALMYLNLTLSTMHTI